MNNQGRSQFPFTFCDDDSSQKPRDRNRPQDAEEHGAQRQPRASLKPQRTADEAGQSAGIHRRDADRPDAARAGQDRKAKFGDDGAAGVGRRLARLTDVAATQPGVHRRASEADRKSFPPPRVYTKSLS